jgi:hypothetical protein
VPPLPAVPRVVRLQLHATFGGDTNVLNRFFFQYQGALSLADAQTWLNAMVTRWLADWVTNLTTPYSHHDADLTDLSTASSPQVFNSVAGAGVNAPPTLSADSAMVIKHRIARRYRGGHSRSYLTGHQAASLSGPNTWSAGNITAYGGFFNTWITHVLADTPVAAAPAVQVNVSFFSGFTNKTFPSGRIHPVPTPRLVPIVDAVIANTVNPKVGSQRRRELQSS